MSQSATDFQNILLDSFGRVRQSPKVAHLLRWFYAWPQSTCPHKRSENLLAQTLPHSSLISHPPPSDAYLFINRTIDRISSYLCCLWSLRQRNKIIGWPVASDIHNLCNLILGTAPFLTGLERTNDRTICPPPLRTRNIYRRILA